MKSKKPKVQLIKNNVLSVKPFPCINNGLCIPGLEYKIICPYCTEPNFINGEEYGLTSPLTEGEIEPCCISFECINCKWLDEEVEFNLKITFDVEVIENDQNEQGSMDSKS